MRNVALLFALIAAVSALTDEEEWLSFKARHGKTYKNLRTENLRFQIFKDNLREITKHNARYEAGEETYEMGVTQFTDLTSEEFVKSGTSHVSSDSDFDWRSGGDRTPVHDQGPCVSGYAFSVLDVIESQFWIFKQEKVVLSAQEIIDCSGAYGNNGCDGGKTANVFKYIRENGISTNADYPYHATVSPCKNSTHAKVAFEFSRTAQVEFAEEALKEALEAIGPVSVSMNSAPLQNYRGGILTPQNCNKTDLNHSVLLVGYGNENGTDYFTFKNSWGTDYGEKGYFRLIRNGKNTCGILSQAYWATLQWN